MSDLEGLLVLVVYAVGGSAVFVAHMHWEHDDFTWWAFIKETAVLTTFVPTFIGSIPASIGWGLLILWPLEIISKRYLR